VEFAEYNGKVIKNDTQSIVQFSIAHNINSFLYRNVKLMSFIFPMFKCFTNIKKFIGTTYRDTGLSSYTTSVSDKYKSNQFINDEQFNLKLLLETAIAGITLAPIDKEEYFSILYRSRDSYLHKGHSSHYSLIKILKLLNNCIESKNKSGIEELMRYIK
jgi:hypothetical protein